MKPALDSAWPPNDVSIAQAKAAGIRVWGGYFAGPNILNGWALSDFHRVQNAGLATLAYCSGLADPIAMRSQSLTWGVPICLDVEGGIRGDGPWVQDWVNRARSGLYGNAGVFTGRTAQFFVCAAYPGNNPNTDWPPYLARPKVPCGWQYQGSSKYFGMTVDLSWFDDELVALLGGSTMLPLAVKRATMANWWISLFGKAITQAELDNWAGTSAPGSGALKDDGSNWDAIFFQLQTSVVAVAWLKHLQATGSGSDDDSVYVKTADLKSAIGGL